MPPLTLRGGCHCGAVSYTIATSTEERLQSNYCHCSDCRKTLGFFFGFFVNVKETQLEIHANPKTALVVYASSDRATRQHCGVCGASITWHGNGDERIDVHAATLELPDEVKGSGKGLMSLFDQTTHLYLQDNWKGGTGVLLLSDGLKKCLSGTRGTTMWEPTEEDKLLPVESDVDDNETIEASCHCGGIKFSIQRPPKDYAEDPLLANWIKTGRRISANHCFCDTCRKVSGAPFWTWAFVPRRLLRFTSTATERTYASHPTKPIIRRFCGKCGCNYSYAASQDFEMWDIAAALLSDDKDDKMERWLAFSPAEGGKDPTDKKLEKYIHGWGMEERGVGDEKPISFPADGEAYNPELLATLREGRKRCQRF